MKKRCRWCFRPLEECWESEGDGTRLPTWLLKAIRKSSTAREVEFLLVQAIRDWHDYRTHNRRKK